MISKFMETLNSIMWGYKQIKQLVTNLVKSSSIVIWGSSQTRTLLYSSSTLSIVQFVYSLKKIVQFVFILSLGLLEELL